MESQAVAAEGLVASIAAARTALADDRLAAGGLDGLNSIELIGVAQQLDQLARRVEAAQRTVAAAVSGSAGYRDDGHRNAGAWMRAATRCSRSESLCRSRGAELLDRMPMLAAAVTEDRVPVAHLRLIGGVYANPRVADAFVAADEWVTELAVTADHDTIRRALEMWEQLADFDGAHQRAEDAHDDRTAALSRVGDEFHLSARCGLTQGELLKEILAHFVEAEYRADVDQAREHITVRPVNAGDLPRTSAQRRFDALFAIFGAAASAPVDGKTPDINVHIVADLATVETAVAAASTGVLDASRIDPQTGRCEFLDGTPVPFGDLVSAVLIGRLRRVVFDTSGVVIDLGRSARLFTGSARLAALLQGLRCIWPGCGQQHHLQVDHTHPHARGGPTSQRNADLMCGHHNRFKHHGHAIRRAPDGTWHLYRPDGTEIAAA